MTYHCVVIIPGLVFKNILCHSKNHWDSFLILMVFNYNSSKIFFLLLLCHWCINYKPLIFTLIKRSGNSYISALYPEK